VARSARGEAGAAAAARVRVADTVGAGDAHTAGFLHGYLSGASLDVRPRTG
jgi:sugar/nucleoside kinase (ribokinase family)